MGGLIDVKCLFTQDLGPTGIIIVYIRYSRVSARVRVIAHSLTLMHYCYVHASEPCYNLTMYVLAYAPALSLCTYSRTML